MNKVYDIYAGITDYSRDKNLIDNIGIYLWISGPILLLLERSPGDAWISLIACLFVVRSIKQNDYAWLKKRWVQSVFLFYAVCILSLINSSEPIYSATEGLPWIRFPLFAIAVGHWIAVDIKVVRAFFAVATVCLILMCGILVTEFLLLNDANQRLQWPYGDPVPGSYLAKIGLPTIAWLAALCTKGKSSSKAILINSLVIFIVIFITALTGERANTLILLCSLSLLFFVSKTPLKKKVVVFLLGLTSLTAIFIVQPVIFKRFYELSAVSLTSAEHGYVRTVNAGVELWKYNKILGSGPATHRVLCPSLVGETRFTRCDNHPHNFYIQLLAEVGAVGLIAGVIMFLSIIVHAFNNSRINRSVTFLQNSWVIPIAFFWPIAGFPDFFGQWQNIFMWGGLSICFISLKPQTSRANKTSL